ncbi:MAG TPA: hypothetical protein VN721_02485 [Flavipsychrobacter sp.]|nr:hypothetical protein [Flavipsychrobacter sp.]
MKPFLLLVVLSAIMIGCEPVDPYMNPSFPPGTFNFSVYPEDSVLHVGDTITFSAVLGNKFGNTTVTDGYVSLGVYIYGSNHVPQTDSFDNFSAYNGVHYKMISYFGNAVYGTGPTYNFLYADTTRLQNDSFKIKFSLVMLKKGLYQISFDEGLLHSSKGKTPVNGVFNVANHHWSFYKIPGWDTVHAGTSDYDRIYSFAVE